MMKFSANSLRANRCALVFGISICSLAGALAQPAAQTVASTESKQTVAEKFEALKAAVSVETAIDPLSIGNTYSDTVYTAVTPCRIVDTRKAGGALTANVTRTFDVDGTNFTTQGGSGTGCGLPYGVVSAVAMTITAVTPSTGGYFTAWGLSTKPNSSTLNFVAGQTIANTTIVPVLPGVGNDFSVASSTNSNLVIDVVGYFAAPVATALDCVNTYSAVTTVSYNTYTAVDAYCTYPYTVTGGGTYPIDGTLGRPGVWTDGSPNAGNGNGWRTWVDNQTGGNRSVQTYARCCRIPGR